MASIKKKPKTDRSDQFYKRWLTVENLVDNIKYRPH